MPIRQIQLLTPVIVLAIAVTTRADAEMSQTEQQAEVQHLYSVCQQDPAYRRWSQQAQGGSKEANFEATDAMLQCFYNNADSRFPAAQKQKWLQEIEANKQKERELK